MNDADIDEMVMELKASRYIIKESIVENRKLKEAVRMYVNSVPFNSSGDVAELAFSAGLFPDELKWMWVPESCAKACK